MITASSFAWFARHELRLSWRDLYAMLSANRPGRGRRILIAAATILATLHLLAWAALKQATDHGIAADLPTLVMVSGFLLLPISLMASQAMESITRAFYTRSDLELILASPAPARKLFAVRMLAIAIATSGLTLIVSAPAIDVLAVTVGPRFLLAYPVILAFGLFAAATAILFTMGMFVLIGPARTRLFAQIAAAIVGAGFVIGVQLLAIASIGSISRFEFLRSDYLLSVAPAIDHWIYLPARGAMGDAASALSVLVFSLVLFAATLLATAGQYAGIVLKAGSIDIDPGRRRHTKVSFAPRSPAAMLRGKEWKLLLRDKWLMSQTLMQLLYLIPPAFMLWHSFGAGNTMMIVAVPVIVMAAGQLAGGLAWLAISGEDAPELVTTAPVSPGQVLRAKVEAVLSAVAIVVAPLLIATAFASPVAALIGAAGACAAVLSSTLIQLWFRSQAKRSNFRRRQTSSRIATLAEAFSSILWAGATGLWVAGSFVALAVAFAVLTGLAITWAISPARIDFAARRALRHRPAPA
ncbi:MAG: permease [Nitratireductor sp.]|nr:permease [Nitratireductor sp.]